MENFKNVDPHFVNVYWDDGRHYSRAVAVRH